MKKIAIPTLGSKGINEMVSEHFGRCKTFTIVNDKGELVQVLDNTSSHNGGTGLPPEILQSHGIDILICQGLGPKALDLCRQFGIQVYVHSGRTVSDIFHNWKNSSQKPASLEDVCEEHRS